MRYGYTNRSVTHSTNKRETSCSRWELTQRPMIGKWRNSKRFWSIQALMGYAHQTPLLNAQGAIQKKKQKDCKSQR